MSGPVDKIIAVTLFRDEVTDHFVHLPTADFLATGKRRLYLLHTQYPGIADDLEDLHMALGGRLANETGPGDVVKAGIGDLLLAPDIEQDEVTLANRRRGFGGRSIVWI